MNPYIFEPLSVGRVTLPNRICFMAHRTNFARQGRLTDRHIAYFRRRAEGGAGLITVGEISIHPNDRPWRSMIEIGHRDAACDFRKLTRCLHQNETPVFAQLNHHGFQSSGAITGQAVWGPSAVADIVFGETAKAMEPEDMAELIDAFGSASIVLRDCGFDGIEIDMGPRSLLRQFLSPISNHRQDEYGGTAENRLRLPMAVVKRVRKEVGNDFTVGIRLCMDEQFYGGISPEDGLWFAQCFENSRAVDFIQVFVGTYYNLYLVRASMHIPVGGTEEMAARLKGTLSVPVFIGHQTESIERAEKALNEQKTDAVGFVRALICDPDLPNKVRAQKNHRIRRCVRDNKGCIGRVNQAAMISCIQNPEVGYEPVGPPGRHSAGVVPKRILVVGAGPAGLEAARSAALRGHSVAVYEKGARAGGQVSLHQIAAGRQPIIHVVTHLLRELDALGVSIVTGTEVTPAFVISQKPDAVIIATGSKPIADPYPGSYGPPSALTVWNVLKADYPIGQKILFLDDMGSHFSTATAEYLADRGKEIDLVSPDLFVGIELASLGDLHLSRQRLLQKGVNFRADITVSEIRDMKVYAKNLYSNEQMVLQGFDTIVIAAGNHAEDDLYKSLKGKIKALYRAGDCVSPRGVDMAILEGRKTGEQL